MKAKRIYWTVCAGVFVGALAQDVVGIAGNGQAVDVYRLQAPPARKTPARQFTLILTSDAQ